MNKCQQSCFHKLPMHIPGAGLSSEAGSSAEPSFFSSVEAESPVATSGSFVLSTGGLDSEAAASPPSASVRCVNYGAFEICQCTYQVQDSVQKQAPRPNHLSSHHPKFLALALILAEFRKGSLVVQVPAV